MTTIPYQADAPPAHVNRTAGYFAKNADDGEPLPTTDVARYEYFTAAIMKTVAVLTAMLDSADPKKVMYAIDKLLHLEQTRIRHARNVIGCERAAAPAVIGFGLPAVEVAAPTVVGATEEDAEEFEGVIPAKTTLKKAENDVEAMAIHIAELMLAFNRRAEAKPGKFKEIDDAEAEAIVKRHLRINKVRAKDVSKNGFVSWAMYRLDRRLGYKE